MAIFTRTDDGSWRRDDERHDNVLVDVAAVPDLFASHGVDVALASRFGSYELPEGSSRSRAGSGPELVVLASARQQHRARRRGDEHAG